MDIAHRFQGGNLDQGVGSMGSDSRSKRKKMNETWVPPCEDQFGSLRALTGAAPRGRSRWLEELDPEFENWLEAFPMD